MAFLTTGAADIDAGLVARMAAGDQAAVSELYDRHRGVVFALALRVLRDNAEAEEVLVDVFLQAWRGAAGFDAARGTVLAWLVMLCRSRAIDRVRARMRRDAVITPLVHGHRAETMAGGDDPMRQLEITTARRRMGAALAALTQPQRAAIELAYYGGLSQTEIAAHLGEPLGTVKTRIRQGLLTLRETLAGDVHEM